MSRWSPRTFLHLNRYRAEMDFRPETRRWTRPAWMRAALLSLTTIVVFFYFLVTPSNLENIPKDNSQLSVDKSHLTLLTPRSPEYAGHDVQSNLTHLLKRDEYGCKKGVPCKQYACCGAFDDEGNGICGLGPAWCGADCDSQCDAKAECKSTISVFYPVTSYTANPNFATMSINASQTLVFSFGRSIPEHWSEVLCLASGLHHLKVALGQKFPVLHVLSTLAVVRMASVVLRMTSAMLLPVVKAIAVRTLRYLLAEIQVRL